MNITAGRAKNKHENWNLRRGFRASCLYLLYSIACNCNFIAFCWCPQGRALWLALPLHCHLGGLWAKLLVGGRCQAHCVWQRPLTTRPTTFHVWKTRGCQCSFRLLMMSGVSPETCWASYKYGIIKFWYIVASGWIFLYGLYYEARIHEPHISMFRYTGG